MLGRYSMTQNWYGIGAEDPTGGVEATGEPATPPASADIPAESDVVTPAWYKRIPMWGWIVGGAAAWMVVRRFGKEKPVPDWEVGAKPTGWWRIGLWGAKKAYRKLPRAARTRIEAQAAKRAAQGLAMGERLEERWWKRGMERAEEKLGPKQRARKPRKRGRSRSSVSRTTA